jgi:pyruvate,water dikinase
MGIPSIVAIAGITRRLKDGEWVEMNGSTGVVKKTQHD